MKPLSQALVASASGPYRALALGVCALGVCALGACALAATACGGPSAPTEPSAPMLIPVQPPQPPAVTSSSAAPRKTDAPRAAVPFKCDGGVRFQVGARSFCAFSELDTWEGSERRCAANGGHLMTLETEATSEAAHGVLGSPLAARRAAWIGLELKNKKKAGTNEWKWSSGDGVKAASWNDSEPNNFDGNEGCGEWLVASGLWNDTRCDQMQAYLCQSTKSGALLKGGGLSCHTGRTFTAGSKTYCLNAAPLSFNDAKKACAADKGRLAELTTAEENRAVRDAMAARFAATTMWIGLTDSPEEGRWAWSSGAPRTFEGWAPGEPNNFGDEDCAQLFADTWTWNDLDCDTRLPSVCEGRE